MSDKIIEMDHYMKCNICGEYFDMRDLSEVFSHEHNGETIDKEYKGKRKPRGQNE